MYAPKGAVSEVRDTRSEITTICGSLRAKPVRMLTCARARTATRRTYIWLVFRRWVSGTRSGFLPETKNKISLSTLIISHTKTQIDNTTLGVGEKRT